jgi:hypothetical protein
MYRRFGLSVINFIDGTDLRRGYSLAPVHGTQSGFHVYNADVIEFLNEDADLSDGIDASLNPLSPGPRGLQVSQSGRRRDLRRG